MAVCSIPKRSHSASVWAKSRAVTWTSWPRARSTSITGRMTSTWGLLVRSIQTRIGARGPRSRRASLGDGAPGPASGRLALVQVRPSTLTGRARRRPRPRLGHRHAGRFATNVVGDLGLPGIFVLMVLESACIPIPSEATMLFAGFNVSVGEYPLWAAVLAGTLGNLVGSWIAYGVGYYGRVELLERHGRKLHVKPGAPGLGRPLVRALRRRRRLLQRACCRSSARSSRCPPASRGCRSGASAC